MALTCNIDERGKAARLSGGISLMVVSLGTGLFWALGGGGAPAWIVTIALFLTGAFMVFEARNSWCVLRAMGIKTPI